VVIHPNLPSPPYSVNCSIPQPVPQRTTRSGVPLAVEHSYHCVASTSTYHLLCVPQAPTWAFVYRLTFVSHLDTPDAHFPSVQTTTSGVFLFINYRCPLRCNPVRFAASCSLCWNGPAFLSFFVCRGMVPSTGYAFKVKSGGIGVTPAVLLLEICQWIMRSVMREIMSDDTVN